MHRLNDRKSKHCLKESATDPKSPQLVNPRGHCYLQLSGGLDVQIFCDHQIFEIGVGSKGEGQTA
eukprot:8280448-Pyramimonas_sp.AAC.1